MAAFWDPPWVFCTVYAYNTGTTPTTLVYSPYPDDSAYYGGNSHHETYPFWGIAGEFEVPELKPSPRPWIRPATCRPPRLLGAPRRRRPCADVCTARAPRSCSTLDHRRNKRKLSRLKIWREVGL